MNIPKEFKFVLITVVVLTTLCLAGLASLAFFGDKGLSKSELPFFQQNLMTACTFGWQAGLGAILGLLGGKATE